MAAFDGGAQPYSNTSGTTIHYLGAAAALALMAGIGVWSYDLIKRDVSGIPVVRAAEGDMRVLPENPGGEVAIHTGLAVNSVAAEGATAELGDTLVLAPATTDLAEEDLVLSPRAEAGEVTPAELASPTVEEIAIVAREDDPTSAAVAEALSLDDIDALADQLAAGAEPIEQLSTDDVVPAVLAVDGAPVVDIISASIPGVTTSLRPIVRPAGGAPQATVQTASLETTVPTAEPAPAPTIPVGTNLVQLGAFPTQGDASAAWSALQSKFGDYMTDKQLVVQAADSGGNTFYRLRALGFSDLSDARRFCAALEAGDADCIPVVVR